MPNPVERGERAKALLANGLLREVLEAMERHYIAAWRAAPSVEAREDCHRYLILIERFTADLTSIATTGALEAQRLKELEGTSKGYLAWPKL